MFAEYRRGRDHFEDRRIKKDDNIKMNKYFKKEVRNGIG
jgi:hypothetical protein